MSNLPNLTPADLSSIHNNSSSSELYIESRLKDLGKRSKSRYIHRKIKKSLEVIENYKKSIKTTNFHNQFRFILGQDAKKSVIGDFSNMRSEDHLESKWSNLSGLGSGDLRLGEWVDIEALGRKIEKRLRYPSSFLTLNH